MKIELSVLIDPEFQRKVDQERLHEIVLQTLSQERIPKPVTIGLLIADDDEIRRLNLEYRGEDRETDVLAFGTENDQDEFASPLSIPVHLGDVVISYPRVVAQAEAYQQSIEEELDRLVVHGLLHLLGYDDQIHEERQRMWDRQETILREFRANARASRP